MYYIGIDVGLSGSICFLDADGKLAESVKMPVVELKDSAYKRWYDIPKLMTIFQNHYPGKVALEYQRPMSNQGVTTMFRLGRGFGLLEGLTHSIYYKDVVIYDPKTWQNYMAKKFLTKEQIEAFKSKSLNYNYILSTIADGDSEFKEKYLKLSGNKTSSPSKMKSLLIYYFMMKQEENVNLKFTDNNIIDAFLISKYCFYSLNSK